MRDLHRLETFAGDGVFHVIVESPRGAVVKLKYSPELKAMSISRPLVLGVAYPCDWGFVPSTEGPDRDPLDAAIWWDVTTYPGVVVPCRALAVVRVEQNRADGSARIRNDRVLAVPVAAARGIFDRTHSPGIRTFLRRGNGARRQGAAHSRLGRCRRRAGADSCIGDLRTPSG